MKNLFAFDSKRGSKYAVELGPLYLDYSKNRFNEKTLQYLLELADEVKLRDKIEAMFTGEKSILPKTGRFCIRLCAIVRTRRYMSTAKRDARDQRRAGKNEKIYRRGPLRRNLKAPPAKS